MMPEKLSQIAPCYLSEKKIATPKEQRQFLPRLAPLTPEDQDSEVSLAEVLSVGKSLHACAESLYTQREEHLAPSQWQGSFLKRCLIGVGILTGAGLLTTGGYRYYAARSRPGNGESPSQPAKLLTALPVSENGAAGTLEDAFGHHVPHHDGEKLYRHRRRHLPEFGATTTADLSDKVKIDTVNRCYEYSGIGRVSGKRQVPCHDRQPTQRTNAPPYLYIYPSHQPQKCKTALQEEKCQTAHDNIMEKKNKRMSSLALNVGKTICFCPPPAGVNVMIIPPYPAKRKQVQGTAKKTRPLPATVPGRITDETYPASSDSVTVSTALTTGAETVVSIARGKFITSQDQSPGSAKSALATSDTVDDVKIVKLYDFSCIDERENMSWVDIIRQVGKTLRSPVQSLAQESLVVHHINTLGSGCPPEEKSQHLAEAMNRVDEILTQVITLLPGANKVALLQLIIGPMLDIYADMMDEKPADGQKLDGINQQLIFLAKHTITTLTSKELITLFDKESKYRTSRDKTGIKNRLSLRDGKFMVDVEGEQYPIITEERTNKLYIKRKDNAESVFFDNEKSRWKVLENSEKYSVSSGYQARCKSFYRIPENKMKGSQDITLTADPLNNDMLLLSFNGDEFNVIFIDGVFIQAEQHNIRQDMRVTVARSADKKEKSVLIPTDSGWIFEAETTNIDRDLAVLLDSHQKGIAFTNEKSFTPIMYDGFSYDKYGKCYIKFRGNYISVEKKTTSIYTFPEFPGNWFTWENGRFSLKSSAEIISIDNVHQAGYQPLDKGKFIYLEDEAHHSLVTSGTEVNTEPVIKIGLGVYIDSKMNMIFSVGLKFYKVSSYTENYVTINTNTDEKIELFRIKDTYYKVRRKNNIKDIEYLKVEGCLTKRSPVITPAKCLPVVTSKNLDLILKNSIRREHYSRNRQSDETIINTDNIDFPNIFFSTKTGKHYYFYDGHYIRAKWISVDSKLNPTKNPILKLYTKGNILRKKKDIVLMVCEIKNGIHELKTVAEYISEKINIPEKVARDFLDNKKNEYIVDNKFIEKLVYRSVSSEKIYIFPLQKYFTSDITSQQLNDYILRNLYSENISANPRNFIMIGEITNIDDEQPFYIRAGKIKIRNHVTHINEEVIPTVLKGLNDISVDYINYFSAIFKTSNIDFIVNFATHLSVRIKEIKAALDPARINVCALYKKQIGEANIYQHKAILTPLERRSGVIAFAIRDSSRQIYINTDKLYFVDPTHPDRTLREYPWTDLTTTLIHEASHIGTMTSDLVYFSREEGTIIPILDSIDELNDYISNNDLASPQTFSKLSERYFQTNPVYKALSDKIIAPHNLAYIASNDPAYLANILLYNADSIALITRDLHKISTEGLNIDDNDEAAGSSSAG